jgi:hypothetical protein
MQVKEPSVVIKFPVRNLVSRRSFVFARAGFGKSNLNKLLFSALYAQTPTVEKRGGRQVPVGTICLILMAMIFGRTTKGRPGLCDACVERSNSVFTPRIGPSPFISHLSR